MFSFFKRLPPPPTKLTIDPDNPIEPALTTIIKTLVIVYDPVVDQTSGKKLSEYMKWNKVENLARGFMSDILVASGGLVRYQVIERYDVDAFPAKIDGHIYEAQEYLNIARGISHPHKPQEADYQAILKQFKILQRVALDEIDEVWIFNFPYGGFHESIMCGPDAFWCNTAPLKNTEASKRRFVIMGFSIERGIGEMLENMAHRAEAIMERTFENTPDDENLWKRFTGQAALGTVHRAPNSIRDYDWNNPAFVVSECDDWLYNFPDFAGAKRQVNADEWGNGDPRKHHIWWMKHFPKTIGRKNGIHNNWWQYIANPNNVVTQGTPRF